MSENAENLYKKKVKFQTLKITTFIAFFLGLVVFLYLYHHYMGGDPLTFLTTLDSIFVLIPPFVPALILYFMLKGAEKKYIKAMETAADKTADKVAAKT